MRTAASLPSGVTCGVVGDRIAVATPPLSMSSSDFCTDQCAIGGLAAPISFMACSQLGAATWWCTSMRRGVACAKLLRAKPPTAAHRERGSAAGQHLPTAHGGRGKWPGAAGAGGG